ncbi:site-2 protease family protein [Patescibacteria group bacterium]|nr:site-2 protease family protein [Patescibacteria group bacterium]
MFITIIAVIVVLSLVIFVHELGHFWAAKKTGTKVEEFGFGYPPRIFGVKKGDTLYSLNWIPFGGFVKIKGEAEAGENQSLESDNYLAKSISQRALIMLAGIVMNILLAVVLFSISFLIGAPADTNQAGDNAIVSDQKIQILTVEEDSPADLADIQEGDAMISIDQNAFTDIDQVNQYNKDKFATEIEIVVERDDQKLTKTLILGELEEDDGSKRAVMGVGLIEVGLVRYPFFKAIWLGVKYTFTFFWLIVVFLYNLIKDLIVTHQVSDAVTGPIGVAFLTSRFVKLGINYMVQFVAIISLNLAVFNLLPFPALDGSKLVFLAIEKIRKKRIDLKVENMFHTVGFFILIVLAVLIAVRDWQRFF